MSPLTGWRQGPQQASSCPHLHWRWGSGHPTAFAGRPQRRWRRHYGLRQLRYQQVRVVWGRGVGRGVGKRCGKGALHQVRNAECAGVHSHVSPAFSSSPYLIVCSLTLYLLSQDPPLAQGPGQWVDDVQRLRHLQADAWIPPQPRGAEQRRRGDGGDSVGRRRDASEEEGVQQPGA